MHAEGEGRTALKAFSMVYNRNARCRGEQVLLRWNDIVESTSPIPVMNNELYEYGTYSTDIHTKDLNGIVAQRKIKVSSLNRLESSAQHVDSPLLAFTGFQAIDTIISNAICHLFDCWPEVVLEHPTSIIFLLQLPQARPVVGSIGSYDAP
jgi:hypothetical protein